MASTAAADKRDEKDHDDALATASDTASRSFVNDQETLADEAPVPAGVEGADVEKGKGKSAPGAKWKEGEVFEVPHKCVQSLRCFFSGLTVLRSSNMKLVFPG